MMMFWGARPELEFPKAVNTLVIPSVSALLHRRSHTERSRIYYRTGKEDRGSWASKCSPFLISDSCPHGIHAIGRNSGPRFRSQATCLSLFQKSRICRLKWRDRGTSPQLYEENRTKPAVYAIWELLDSDLWQRHHNSTFLTQTEQTPPLKPH
jgi:hypothetical protein